MDETDEPYMITVAENDDPNVEPLEEETEVSVGVYESDEVSPIDLRTSIEIGTTKISTGVHKSVFANYTFDTDDEVTTRGTKVGRWQPN